MQLATNWHGCQSGAAATMGGVCNSQPLLSRSHLTDFVNVLSSYPLRRGFSCRASSRQDAHTPSSDGAARAAVCMFGESIVGYCMRLGHTLSHALSERRQPFRPNLLL